MLDPMTGEIILDNDIDLLLSYIIEAEKTIKMLKTSIDQAKEAVQKYARFSNGNTARIEGDKYCCRIERPTKVKWDQKKLAAIDKIYPHGTIVDSIIKIESYKVNMFQYRKLINTVGNDQFNKFRDELMSANLGIVGSPKFTIEEK